MIGQQAYIYNKNNHLIDAAITATIAASQRTPLVYPVTKEGTGNIAVSGNYTGALDSKYEVIISDTSFTNPVVSSPVFRGAGTGKIKDVAVAGLAAQKITIMLQSTGVDTQQATAEIEGLQFRAKATGAAGNAITIEIDNSEIVSTLTTYSTLKDLKVGDTGLVGQEWDFDTKTILGNIVPDTAHRIRFGDDLLHIYRQYKKFEDGAYKYYFIQPIKYEVKAGSKVYFVTEGRTVTVSDGVTDEVYEDIITIADFWTAVKAASVLIEPVESSIDTSKTPDSPSVRELSVMTDAYALPSYAGDNSSEYAGVVESVVVSDLTKTELVSIECVDNTFIGEELWTVKGSSSGDLGQVKTGLFYGVGPVGFAIPQRFPKDWDTRLNENWSSKVDYAARNDGVDPPPICLSFRQGAKSIAQTLQLEYTKKPTDCICPVVTFDDYYLGLQKEGGEKGMAYTIEDLTFLIDSLKERMIERFAATEGDESEDVTTSFAATFKKYDTLFKTLGKRLTALTEDDPVDLAAMLADFKSLINNIYLRQATSLVPTIWGPEAQMNGVNYVLPATPNGFAYGKDSQTVTSGDSGVTEPNWPLFVGVGVWDNNAIQWWTTTIHERWITGNAVAAGAQIVPSVANGYVYEAITAGEFGASEPTWPEVIGETVEDGEVTWRCKRAMPEWTAETTYSIGDICRPTEAALDNHEFSIMSINPFTGATEPTWPDTIGETVTDGDMVWRCYATCDLWDDETDVIAGKMYQPSTPNNNWYLCIQGGTTGTTEPAWPGINYLTVTDGTARFMCCGTLLSMVSIYRWDGNMWVYGFDSFYEMAPQVVTSDLVYDTTLYQKIVDAVLLYEKTYGLKKNSLSLKGDVPYNQGSEDFYWKFISGDKQYLPAFTDIPYYSVINACGCGYDYIGTKEFGLNISVPCGGSLKEGDKITIIINGLAEHTYLLGDKTFLPTVAAAALNFVGGIDGDDTYTFEVAGTVDAFADYLLDRDAPLPYKGTLASAWQAGHSYSLTNYVKAVTFNGYRYECTTAGTSGGTQPTWGTVIGGTTADGTVVWTCRACELLFEITDGIVPFSVGDSFEFNIEGGHFKWRKDGGAWSSAISITETATSVAEGLSVAFVFGVSPSFVVDDQWEILCVQENKASNLTLPWDQSAKGTNTISFAFASPVDVDALVIDEHTLTGTVKFQASNVSNFAVLLHDETLTITDLICNLYSTPITAQYFRLYFTGAYEIGYLFLGEMMRLASDADSIVPLKRYSMSRQGGKKPFSLYNYQSKGFNIQYNSFIAHADYLLLDEMIEYLKALNDMPFYLVPNINYPTDCMKGRIDTDNQEPGSDIDYNVPPANRIYTLTLPVMSA